MKRLNPNDMTREMREEAVAWGVKQFRGEGYAAETNRSVRDTAWRSVYEGMHNRVDEALGPSDDEHDRELVSRMAADLTSQARERAADEDWVDIDAFVGCDDYHDFNSGARFEYAGEEWMGCDDCLAGVRARDYVRFGGKPPAAVVVSTLRLRKGA